MPKKRKYTSRRQHPRAITITLPGGETILRVDYMRKRWAEGASRREIAAEVSKLQGKKISYQLVFGATKGLGGGKRERGKIDILILNGPNLNMLGQREPEIYGKETLKDIEDLCRRNANRLKLSIEFVQSNHEGELIDYIQKARGRCRAIIINPASYSHTSIGILDALHFAKLPVVEVHLSNIHKREEFRHHSYVSKVADGVICGLGAHGYVLALYALAQKLALGK